MFLRVELKLLMLPSFAMIWNVYLLVLTTVTRIKLWDGNMYTFALSFMTSFISDTQLTHSYNTECHRGEDCTNKVYDSKFKKTSSKVSDKGNKKNDKTHGKTSGKDNFDSEPHKPCTCIQGPTVARAAHAKPLISLVCRVAILDICVPMLNVRLTWQLSLTLPIPPWTG